MEIRRCDHTFFIQAIRGGLVIKVPNRNSHGRPALSFKTLKDVYESIDGETLSQSPISSRIMKAGMPMVDRTLQEIKTEADKFVSHSDCLNIDSDDDTTLRQLKDKFLKRKRKSCCIDEHFNLARTNENPVEDEPHLDFPMVDRTLRGVKSEKDDFAPHSDNGLDSDSDDDTTLKQLKKNFHEKKRKISGGEEHHSMLAYSNESSFENESDLNEPIICLKAKKASRKCRKGSVDFSSTTAFNVKCEVNFVSEGSQQVASDLPPVIHVKVEDDAKDMESPRKNSFYDGSFCDNEVRCPGDEVSTGIEFKKPLFSAEECENCVTNEISYDHLEDIELVSEFVPSEDIDDKVETPELQCYEVLEEISEQTSSSSVQDHDMATDCDAGYNGLRDESIVQLVDNLKAGLPREQDNCLSTNPDKYSDSVQNSVTSLKTDDITRTLDDITENRLNCEININDELLKTEERQASVSAINTAESRSSTKNQSFDSYDMISTTEPCMPPERLLSTRKAISPSSQERLCSAMNSVEPCNDVGQISSKPNGQLCEGENRKKALSTGSDIQHAKIAVNHGGHGQVSLRKVDISSRHIIKKTHNTKANLEGPRFSRVLSNFSTECTSIQGCSKSAIAFSQRQMQDMESLAFKLIDELESMKCIIQQKLLFEAYRSVPLKSDADEVKSVISNASKMEETARKWLSTMSRDCKRFCKIMKMTPNSSPASKDAVPREKRKIVFADEAGLKLCHVKIFEAVDMPPLPDGVKQ